MSNQQILDRLEGTEIAVVGMSGRFPGAVDIEAFWQNLRNGVESVTCYNDDQLRASGVDDATLGDPHYVKSGMPLDGMEQFDAGFFDFSPRDAAILDPQHRHFLECTWQALEHAGYDPARFDGPIGVYGGSGHNIYLAYNLLSNPQLVKSVGFFLLRHTGNDKDFLTTRVSYLFNLKGPSVNVQTACSTSLVAVHMAAQSLLSRECDMALAGGVTIELPHRQGYMYHEGEILSPNGHCRAFDTASEGTVFGSGVGVVVLRRLDDAIASGDTIHGVILGSAINNDGAGKVNYLAPSVDGQAAAVAEAIALANVDPETITYIETHGTGTRIGDPIEIAALTQAFRQNGSSKASFCGIGSVKTNIGHLDTAAGIAGLIKAVLALKHGEIPASLNFTAPNPMIDFANTPFYVNANLNEWRTADNTPRRAGVNSLGVGGTNAHVILEEAPQLVASSPSRSWQLMLLSAKSASALNTMTANLRDYLRNNLEIPLADAAYTLQIGRQQFKHRRIAVCDSVDSAVSVLDSRQPRQIFSGNPGDSQPAVVFMFSGGGAQYPNMARELYEQEPLFRAQVEHCLELLKAYLDVNLKDFMFPASSASQQPHQEDNESPTSPAPSESNVQQEMERPSLALPALFITEYALATLWQAWGIKPTAMIGHSMGEYTAACLAGVLSLKDALAIVTLRGKLFETLPEGAMLSVSLPESQVKPLLVKDVDIAVINNPELCVVSGPVEAIEQMEKILARNDTDFRRVKIAVAAHSPMLEPILDEFRQYLSNVQFNSPDLPFISNVTGNWVTAQEVTDPDYWVRHLRHTVRFADGLGTLLAANQAQVFLEVGPGQTLSNLAQMHPDFGREHTALASLRHPREEVSDMQFLLTSLGRLWLAGLEPDWAAFYQDELRYRIPLPTYPFEHQRYWIEPGRPAPGQLSQQGQPRPKKLSNLDDWFYQPVWQQSNPPLNLALELQTWLIFSDELGLGEALAQHLQNAGHKVIQVSAGRQFEQLEERHFVINPHTRADYETLTRIMVGQKLVPQQVILTWPFNIPSEPQMESFYRNQDLGFNSLLYLAQTLGGEALRSTIQITVVSNGMQSVAGEPLLYPEKATLLGPCQVIPREYPHITCQSIDMSLLDATKLSGETVTQFINLILGEINSGAEAPIVAYRQGVRHVRCFEPAQVSTSVQNRLRPHGVYLITGGLGGIGLVMAKHLAQTVRARLVLISRSGLPPREIWSDHLRVQDTVSQQIQQVQELEAMGGQVLPLAADVTNWAHMEEVIDQTFKEFGAIHGIIHAAGILADGPIQFKSPDEVLQVLLPKVGGVLILDRLIKSNRLTLDFFVLFSSTSSFLGLPGQVDYSGANAFLNAFAQSKTDTYTVAINWGMWQQVGMAAKAAQQSGLVSQNGTVGTPVDHPLLDTCLIRTLNRRVYSTRFSQDQHWILSEHKLRQGDALIPGTGYLELAKAAFENGSSNGPVEIQDLIFMSPLNLKDDETREILTILQQEDTKYTLTVVSKLTPLNGGSEQWQEHVRGTVHSGKKAKHLQLDIQKIAARCLTQPIADAKRLALAQQNVHMDFGPRWQNIKQVMFGTGEALALLELPDDFSSDVQSYTLHPALMDMATAFALPLISGYQSSTNLFVPLSYKQVSIYHNLPQKIYSYVHLNHEDLHTPSFDVTIMDEDGKVLVEITEFTMAQVESLAMSASRQVTRHQATTQPNYAKDSPGLLKQALTNGILPDEGVEAFARILGNHVSPQIIVSSLDIDKLIKQVDIDYAPVPEDSGLKLARPDNLETSYKPPQNDIERGLVDLWKDLLGIDKIGTEDNFFELGGHSLIAVRLFVRIKKVYAVDFSLATLFDAPTIAQLAKLLQSKLGDTDGQIPILSPGESSEWSPLVTIQPKGNRPPFFCVHGIHGNVLVFYHLTRHLGQQQPFYALQAYGVDGKRPAIESLPEMAAKYIKAMKSVQPEGPYYLGGFSMGGEIAFEIAQQLHQQGDQVAILVLFDTYEPGYVRRRSRTGTKIVARQAVTDSKPKSRNRNRLFHFIQRSNQGKIASLKGWADAQRKRFYATLGLLYLKAGQPMPQKVIELYLEKIHRQALLNYQPQPYPGRITLFRANITLPLKSLDPSLSWVALAKQGVDLHLLHAPHEIIEEPYVQVLVQKLSACLEQARHQ